MAFGLVAGASEPLEGSLGSAAEASFVFGSSTELPGSTTSTT